MHFASPNLFAYLSPRLLVVALVLSPLALIVGAALLPALGLALAHKRLRRALRKHLTK